MKLIIKTNLEPEYRLAFLNALRDFIDGELDDWIVWIEGTNPVVLRRSTSPMSPDTDEGVCGCE